MYSNALELSGLALVAVGVGMLLGLAAGLIAGGVAVVFVGTVTDDAAVGRTVRRAARGLRNAFRAQTALEDAMRNGPHPPIEIDAETEEMARRLATQRVRRGDGRMTEALP